EEIQVEFYVEGMADVRSVLSVPRWSSEGEVLEAGFRLCAEEFGPSQGLDVDLSSCMDLVEVTVRDRREDTYHRMVRLLEDHLARVNPNFEFEGHTGGNPEKVWSLGSLAREGGEHVQTVCEIGFNAGHSALNWLLNTGPDTKVVAFDLGGHPYVIHAVQYLQQNLFPGRLDLVLGSSQETVPSYALQLEAQGKGSGPCNILFVDGDHTQAGALADLENFERLANR
ncbi:unnamed protein product, partial [Discosporangium mesarthrocarpum]